MRKVLLILLGLWIILLMTSSLEANGPAQKLVRGGVNILTSPLEIPKQTRDYWKKGAQRTPHIIVWIVSGAVKGVIETTKRFGSGAWDVITFPIAVPGNYEPLLKPDYIFED